MTDGKFDVGDPVWSKMKGYCPWPSRIAAPHESALRNTAADKLKTPKVHYLVYFFGSNNFAWMPEDTIKPYEEFKDKNKGGSKNAQFKQGLKQVEDYIANGGKATLMEESAVASAAIKNNTNTDNATSPSAAGDNLSNDASNIDVPSSIQKDYSRVPFKSRKTTKIDESATEITSPTKRVKTSDEDSYGTSSLSSPTISTPFTTSRPPTTKAGARDVLLRAQHYADVPTSGTTKINMSSVLAKSKDIRASNLKFGFLGLGFMGQRILKNLLNSGHQVTVWNRSTNKCKEFVEAGASSAKTPADVVADSDIVFSCVSDPKASKEIVFNSFGVLHEINSDKGYVEMSSIDPETSSDIAEAIISKGGRYLEAPPILNGKDAAENGDLTIVAAGDRILYEDCKSCFQAIGKKTFFLGHQVGNATKMHLILSMLHGTTVAAVAECCTLVDLCGLQLSEFREILKLSIMNSPLAESTVGKLMRKDKEVHVPLGHLQKDLRLALALSEEYDQSCPITAISNEVLKNSKRCGYTDDDESSVFIRSRFG